MLAFLPNRTWQFFWAWRCNCGHEGTLDRNGSHADAMPVMQTA
jgi:hypothetical protein